MKIAFYTDSFYPHVSGVSTAVFNLAENLAKRGHLIFIQAPEPKAGCVIPRFHKNIQVDYRPAVDLKIYPDYRLGSALPFSLKKIRQFDPDIIHIHTPLTFGFQGILTAKALSKPIIQTFHTYFMDTDAIKIVGIKNKRIARIVEQGGWKFHRLFSSFFSCTIAPTKFVAKDLKIEKTPGKIVICPNILDESVYQTAKIIDKKTLPKLIYVGRLSAEKRVDLLIKTLAELKKKDLLFELIVVGDGPIRESLFSESFKLGVASQIKWLGSIPHRDLVAKNIYQNGDIFFTLSRFETFGYTTVEAMAQGLPVLAQSSRVNKEIIGQGGVLLPDTKSEDKTIKSAVNILSNYLEYDWNSLAKKAHQEAEKYHPKNLITIYEKIYQDNFEQYQNSTANFSLAKFKEWF